MLDKSTLQNNPQNNFNVLVLKISPTYDYNLIGSSILILKITPPNDYNLIGSSILQFGFIHILKGVKETRKSFLFDYQLKVR